MTVWKSPIGDSHAEALLPEPTNTGSPEQRILWVDGPQLLAQSRHLIGAPLGAQITGQSHAHLALIRLFLQLATQQLDSFTGSPAVMPGQGQHIGVIDVFRIQFDRSLNQKRAVS